MLLSALGQLAFRAAVSCFLDQGMSREMFASYGNLKISGIEFREAEVPGSLSIVFYVIDNVGTNRRRFS